MERELAGRLPGWVQEIRVEIDDDAATADVLSKNTRQVRSLLGECVRQLEIPHWPYIRFRTSSERAEATLEAVK